MQAMKYMILFIVELLYDTMISIDSEQAADTQMYCCGVIKNLAGNPNLSETLSGKCTLYTLATILARVNKLVSYPRCLLFVSVLSHFICAFSLWSFFIVQLINNVDVL